MSTVHTEYGPGRIIERETVRGRTRYKVAGDGFEVWLDQTKVGGVVPDLGAPDEYFDEGDDDVYAYHPEGLEDPSVRGDAVVRRQLRHPHDPEGYFDESDPARYSSRRTAGDWAEDRYQEIANDDPYSEYAHDPRDDVRELAREYGLRPEDRYYDDEIDPRTARVVPGKGRVAWAPFDRGNSTELPYNPDPQHHAIGTPGDDGSSTIQPIHNIDRDERLSPSDSVTFDDEGDEGGPGPDPDLFAKSGAVEKKSIVNLVLFQKNRDRLRSGLHNALGRTKGELAFKGLESHVLGNSFVGSGLNSTVQNLDARSSEAINWASPGGAYGGYGSMIKPASVRLSGPEMALIAPLVRAVAPSAISALMGGGDEEGPTNLGPGEGYGDMIEASLRPAGLSDKYIDITADVDYHNDSVAQFRHDPVAYINRVGHLMDEGLNPRFAEYMDLVEADGGVRTSAWKDVRKKAMRLKREGHVHVKDIAPNRIMASVEGDHGTYDVVIFKSGSYGGLNEGMPGHSISNWHCACEWGKWAFRRKYTYVGRLCSHAYASYLTMQSAHMKGKPRQQKGPKRQKPVRSLPFLHVKRGGMEFTADALQNGPERLTPEMVVNDADDAHIFLDVTKDEREDTGPDDVVSDKDIVHFARVMRECEAAERPYPRALVAFLARYADCASGADDKPSDWEAPDSGDADEYLNRLRSLADGEQSDDFGGMAERVKDIQRTVEEAREHGADASQFVARLLTAADEKDRALFGPMMGGPGTQGIGNYMNAPLGLGGDFSIGRGGDASPAVSQRGFTTNNPTNNAPTVGAPVVNNGGQAANPNAAPAAGGGGAGRGPTTGPVADGGKAGAENGNNAAIGKDQLDADGYYTIGEGDTLTDIAQRAYGDMNKYQDLAKANSNITNVDSLTVGDKIKIDNPTGNGGVSGDRTNPADGGSDKSISTPETTTPSSDTPAAADKLVGPAIQQPAPAQKPAGTTAKRRSTAKAPGDASSTTDPNGQAADAGDAQNPTGTPPAGQAATPTTQSPGAKPATNPATAQSSTAPKAPGATEEDVYDPNDPNQKAEQDAARPGQQPASMPATNTALGGGMGGGMDALGTGIGVAGDVAQGIGSALPGIAQGVGSALPGVADAIGGIASGIGSIFASKADYDDFVRYAYPTADGEGDLEPHTHPFAGSGYPGPLEIGTSEEYADEARAKADDVTDLGDDPLSTPMGKWQRQSAAQPDGGKEDREWAARTYGGDPDDYTRNEKGDLVNGKGVGKEREASYAEATDDDSDIVRVFQANLDDTALSMNSGVAAGRFDDIAGAAQGFLRTAGRNYSLAEQSELIREGDKGGARNLDSLDLTGTHYEDMTTLGW